MTLLLALLAAHADVPEADPVPSEPQPIPEVPAPPTDPCDRMVAQRSLLAPPTAGFRRDRPRAPLSTCLGVRADVAGRLSFATPDVGLAQRFDLARGRLDVGLWGPGPVSARVALVAVRSGGGTSYVGIDGEAIVPKLRVAEARVDVPEVGLAAGAGLIDDLWVLGEGSWGMRIVADTMSERQLGMVRADLGGWLGWTSPAGWVSVTASYTTGEGFDRRERNEGKNLAAQLVVRPLAFQDDVDLRVVVYGRDGSLGVGSARDHRVGGRVAVDHRHVGGAVEALAAWGAEGDAGRLPLGWSAWAYTGPEVPWVLGLLRVELAETQRGRPESRLATWHLAAGPLVPLARGAQARPLYAVLGYEGAALGPDARAAAGAEAAARQHMVYLQLGFRGEAGLPVTFKRGVHP